MNDRRMERLSGLVQVLNERRYPANVLEAFRATVTVICKVDLQTGIQERQLSQAVRQDVEAELNFPKDREAWEKCDARPAFCGRLELLQRRDRVTVAVFLGPFEAIPVDVQPEGL